MPARLLERLTKLVVLAWAAAALVVEVSQLAAAWPELPALAIGVFVVACGAAMFTPRAIGGVLVFAYVFPAMIYTMLGSYVGQYDVLWMVALAGAMAPTAIRTAWRTPMPWRGPLVCWALVIVVGASIIAAREIDFTLALMTMNRLSNSSTGLWPAYVVAWVLHVALVLVLGILWFDWMFSLEPGDFAWGVAAPLAVSCILMCLTTIYQMAFNLSAIKPSIFAALGRASGSVLDANVAGIIAALWSGGFVLMGRGAARWKWPILAVGLIATWLAVWAAGSRTAFAATVIIAVFTAVGVLTNGRAGLRTRLRPSMMVGAAAVAALLLVGGLVSTRTGVVGPARRVWETLPNASMDSVRAFAAEMWNRNGYGEIAADMTGQFPLYGVGVGMFTVMVPDYRTMKRQNYIPRDNAQNWYRHQLAEFGLIGSLPWLVWVVLFAAFLFVAPRADVLAVRTTQGMIVAFALVSLLGMPGQDLAVAVTFWSAAFFLVSVVGVPNSERAIGLYGWAAIAMVVIVFGGGTISQASGALRVPARAQRAGWPYSYGFYSPQPDGKGGEQRWTARHAVGVFDASDRWMRLTVSEDYRALLTSAAAPMGSAVAVRPTDVEVRRDGEIVLQTRLTDNAPVTKYISVPADEKRILLETRTSRTFRPRDVGVPDDRELGVLVSWSFVTEPPMSASIGQIR